MKGYIYSLIDPRDNIVKYVGKTTFDLNKRFNEHLRNCNYINIKTIPVYIWIAELKEENLIPLIKLIEVVEKSEINFKEKYWISHYKSDDLKNVLNGGDTYSFIKKRSFSESHRKGIGDSCRGNKHYNYNKPAHNIKPIYMFDKNSGKLINEFKSIKDATESTGISQSSISFCLLNKRNSGGEYIWIYKDSFDSNNEQLYEKINKCKENPSNINKSHKVLQLNIENNEIINKFSSFKEAARNIKGSSDVGITYACRKSKSHEYKGYKWNELNKNWTDEESD